MKPRRKKQKKWNETIIELDSVYRHVLIGGSKYGATSIWNLNALLEGYEKVTIKLIKERGRP